MTEFLGILFAKAWASPGHGGQGHASGARLSGAPMPRFEKCNLVAGCVVFSSFTRMPDTTVFCFFL